MTTAETAVLKKDPTTRLGATYDLLKPMALNGSARTTAATAIGSKADEYAGPSTLATPGSNVATDRFVFSPCGARQVAIPFMAVGADNSTASGTIWGWQPIDWSGTLGLGGRQAPTKYVARPLLTITLVAGARTVQNVQQDPLSLGVSGYTWRYVDTIAIVADYTFGGTASVVFNSGADSWPMLMFDPCGQPIIEFEPVNGTTTQLLPFWAAV
jgi:hypothetical protein